jgi:hypothetical protein
VIRGTYKFFLKRGKKNSFLMKKQTKNDFFHAKVVHIIKLRLWVRIATTRIFEMVKPILFLFFHCNFFGWRGCIASFIRSTHFERDFLLESCWNPYVILNTSFCWYFSTAICVCNVFTFPLLLLNLNSDFFLGANILG